MSETANPTRLKANPEKDLKTFSVCFEVFFHLSVRIAFIILGQHSIAALRKARFTENHIMNNTKSRKGIGGRPHIPPYYKADKSIRVSQSQIDEMAKLGKDKMEMGRWVRQQIDIFIKANGGSTYERK